MLLDDSAEKSEVGQNRVGLVQPIIIHLSGSARAASRALPKL